MQVVLLHALPFGGAMWDDVRTLIDAPVLAPTLYDLGASIEKWAAAVLDLAPPGPLLVAGNSVGGSCALEMARLAPDRVDALMLIGAKAGVRPEPSFRDEALAVLADDGLEAAWDRYWAPLFGPDTTSELLEAARSAALEQAPDSVARGVRAFHDRRDLTDVVERWTRPLVVVSGEHDRAPAPDVTRPLALAPGRSFHLVSRCGHYVPLERPGVIADLLADLVRSVG